VKVGALERVIVAGAQPVSAPEKITRETAASLAADFSVVPKSAPAASTEALSAEVKQISLRDAMQLVGVTSPTSGGSSADQGVIGDVSGVVGGLTSTTTRAVSDVSSGRSTLTGGATGVVTGLTAPVTQAVAPGVSPVTSPVTNLVTTATNTVSQLANPVTNTILPNLLHKP